MMDTKEPSSESAYDRSVREHFLQALRRGQEEGEDILLVVDDDDAIRQLVIHDLRKAVPRVRIFEAKNGREALARVQEIREALKRDPTLMVLDLHMPEMDGFEVIRRLGKEYREGGKSQGIPIIVLSSTSGEKGILLRQSVHGSHAHYVPLVGVAKENCVAAEHYDAMGMEGLLAWTRHFLHRGRG